MISSKSNIFVFLRGLLFDWAGNCSIIDPKRNIWHENNKSFLPWQLVMFFLMWMFGPMQGFLWIWLLHTCDIVSDEDYFYLYKPYLLKNTSSDMELQIFVKLTVFYCWKQIFNDFLHNEFGGPGTLLVEPFTDMFVALKEKKLPGAPVAARASLLWAQKHLDHDWEVWNSNSPKWFPPHVS